MSGAWKKISEKNGGALFKEWCITKALDGTEGDTGLKNAGISDSRVQKRFRRQTACKDTLDTAIGGVLDPVRMVLFYLYKCFIVYKVNSFWSSQ